MARLGTLMIPVVTLVMFALVGVARPAMYVYVSNAEDGNIGTYVMAGDGRLAPGGRVPAGKLVMPMSVSPDKRYLYAAVRTKPFTVVTYAIDPKTGVLAERSRAPLAESFPYVATDQTGRYLLGASYGGNLVSVNAIGADGKISEPLQVVPTARNAHSIITDKTNRYVFVPHLGTDQIFQFRFDATTGRLTANTPPVVQMKMGTGPRHIIMSSDNTFAYLLQELTADITTLALDANTGLLTPVSSMPDALQKFSLVNPLRYMIDIAQRVYLEGSGPDRLSADLWPLSVTAGATLSIGALAFRTRIA